MQSAGSSPARAAASGNRSPSAHAQSGWNTHASVIRSHRSSGHSARNRLRTAGSRSAAVVADRSAVGSQSGRTTIARIEDARRYG